MENIKAISDFIFVSNELRESEIMISPSNELRESEIMISPVCDSTGITSENWYQSEEKRRVVFGEVEKIGKYLGQF